MVSAIIFDCIPFNARAESSSHNRYRKRESPKRKLGSVRNIRRVSNRTLYLQETRTKTERRFSIARLHTRELKNIQPNNIDKNKDTNIYTPTKVYKWFNLCRKGVTYTTHNETQRTTTTYKLNKKTTNFIGKIDCHNF